MQVSTPNKGTVADRIKLPMTFDVSKMMTDIASQNLREFIYYSVLPLTAPTRKENVLTTDFADGSWADWNDMPALLSSPYLSRIVNYFREHCDVTLVRLLRLEAGATVREHTDPTLALEVPDSVIRLTIPIQVNDGVTFYLNRTPVDMKPGECWYLRLSDPHCIINAGTTERINMSIDMRPNEWIRNMIFECDELTPAISKKTHPLTDD